MPRLLVAHLQNRSSQRASQVLQKSLQNQRAERNCFKKFADTLKNKKRLHTSRQKRKIIKQQLHENAIMTMVCKHGRQNTKR